MYKQVWCTCRVVVLLIKPIAFLPFSSPSPLLSSLLSLPSANNLPDCQKPAFLMFGLMVIFSLGSMPRTPSNSTPTKCQKNKTYKSNLSLRKSNVHFHIKKMGCLLPLTELKLSPRDYYSSFNLLLQVTFALIVFIGTIDVWEVWRMSQCKCEGEKRDKTSFWFMCSSNNLIFSSTFLSFSVFSFF